MNKQENYKKTKFFIQFDKIGSSQDSSPDENIEITMGLKHNQINDN